MIFATTCKVDRIRWAMWAGKSVFAIPLLVVEMNGTNSYGVITSGMKYFFTTLTAVGSFLTRQDVLLTLITLRKNLGTEPFKDMKLLLQIPVLGFEFLDSLDFSKGIGTHLNECKVLL